MIEIDHRFRRFKALDAQRRRRNVIRRIVLAAGGVLGLALTVVVLFSTGILHLRTGDGFVPQGAGPGEQPLDAAVFVPAFVDLPGDPLRISLSTAADADEKARSLPRPAGVPLERAPGDVVVLADTMVAASQRFMATLPSSPQDFAFYQTLKVSASVPADRMPAVMSDTVTEDPGPPESDATNAAPATDRSPSVTTSVAVVVSRSERATHDRDFFTKVLATRSLGSLILETGLPSSDAELFDAAMVSSFDKASLEGGDVVAIRAARSGGPGTAMSVVQVSLYSGTSYLGTLARGDDGSIGTGSEPWLSEDLFKYSGEENVSKEGQQYRLLDAIYSTALRNSVPAEVLNQSISLLARSFDLSSFATNSDKLVLAYGHDREGDASGPGHVLYVSVQGPDRNLQCYVFKLAIDGDYSCFTATTRGQSIGVSSGMLVPVRGSLTAPFGPAVDPATQQKFNNTGVDWAAPVGTPVLAAFAGTVSFAGDGGDAGTLVTISHSGGRETSYGSLDGVAAGLAEGTRVAAGDLIGYVGATGKSVSPHLHFELHVGGIPVNPLQTEQTNTDDDAAVTTLVDQIVRVESGGNATAKNPLSSAYGLGQFISSTWLRMMRTYRPDLSSSMSQDELLALRADPTLAREMVTNLAREGESYLRARGQRITAGTLYLCHFLGMDGAAIVLAAAPETPIEILVTTAVLNANPTILPGRSASQVAAWAEGVMTHRRGSTVPPAPPVPPEFKIYQAAIDTMLEPAMPAPVAINTDQASS